MRVGPFIATLVAMAAVGAAASAQTPVDSPTAPATADPAAKVDLADPAIDQPAPTAMIPAGSPVTIEIAEQVSTKTHRKGDTFAIRLADPIVFEGRTIVPAGTPGMGQVIDSGRSGIGGAPAKLVLAARYLEAGGQRIPLRALRFSSTGKDNTNMAMALGFVPYAGVLSILVHGGEITVFPGATGGAKLAADLPATAPAVVTAVVEADPAEPEQDNPEAAETASPGQVAP